jgi:hypothetical protein
MDVTILPMEKAAVAMRRIMIGAAMTLAAAGTCYAKLELKVTPKGTELALSNFRGEQMPAFEVFREKCVRCHDEGRIVKVLETGTSAITGAPYTRKSMLDHGLTMLRKGHASLDKKEIRQVVDLMEYLMGKAREP